MGLTFAKMIDVPPVWLAGFAFVLWWGARILPLSLGTVGWVVGTALVAVGLGLIVGAALQFRRHRTSIVPHMRASHLLTTGLYAVSRNPIYLADALILAGLSLRWGAAWGGLLVPVFCLIIRQRFILGEEARLREDFPAEFADYTARTRRWL